MQLRRKFWSASRWTVIQLPVQNRQNLQTALGCGGSGSRSGPPRHTPVWGTWDWRGCWRWSWSFAAAAWWARPGPGSWPGRPTRTASWAGTPRPRWSAAWTGSSWCSPPPGDRAEGLVLRPQHASIPSCISSTTERGQQATQQQGGVWAELKETTATRTLPFRRHK